MIELALILGLIYWIGTEFGDHIGTILLGILIVVLIIAFCGAWRKGDKAYSNFVDYWAEGGADRRRRRG